MVAESGILIKKEKIPKKAGGFHVEIIKLSELVTTGSIATEMTKVAGDRILDPPPYTPIESGNTAVRLA